MVLIAHCEQIRDSKIITGSRGVVRVCEYHILSVNFNGQQQNKSFDIMEINFWLEFADVIFGGTSDSWKYVCIRRIVSLKSLLKFNTWSGGCKNV